MTSPDNSAMKFTFLVESCFSDKNRGLRSEQLAQEFMNFVAGLEIADTLDLPLQPDAGMLKHPRAHGLSEIFKFVTGRGARIDHEVAMHGRHLRAADHQPAAAGLVDLLPGGGAVEGS